MHRRSLVRSWRAGRPMLTWVLAMAGCLSLCGLAVGQSDTSGRIGIPTEPALEQSLQRGVQLESEGRWGEALSHYEDAIRDFPYQPDLQQRLTRARLHYDLARRYADGAYRQALQRIDIASALDVFSEVTLKVEYHHVDRPDWTTLILRGTDGLEAALDEEAFVQEHHVDAAAEAKTSLLRQVRDALSGRAVHDRQEAREVVRWVGDLAQQQLRLQPSATVMEYTCALVSSLDNYSAFLTRQQLDEVIAQIEGNFVGLGIELKTESDRLLIVNVISGGPAAQAGIRPGDRIVAVEGQAITAGTAQRAADMLKGEQGTRVLVDVLDAQGQRRRVSVRRERVEVPSVDEVKMVDPDHGVGYFRLTSFQKTTGREVDSALWKLHRQGMRSLVIDVRGNPGGSLPECVEVVDKFISDGAIVRTRGRSSQEDFDYLAHRVGTWRVPLVVLIDGESASASEIFAGAIRDHQRGTIVGQRSYGKGSVQGIFPLRHLDAGVRLTTSKFYSPNGQPISSYGITPDVPVQVVARPVTADSSSARHDGALQAAVQTARQNLPQR